MNRQIIAALLVAGTMTAACASATVMPPTENGATQGPTTEAPPSPRPSRTRPPIHTPTALPPTLPPVPIADLTLEQASRVADLLAQPQDCLLPCWNGLTPGVSRHVHLQGFFARLGVDVRRVDTFREEDGSVRYYGYSSPNVFGAPFPIEITLRDGVVDHIAIFWDSTSRFSQLERLFDTLGPPDMAAISVGQHAWYNVLLDFQSHRTAVLLLGSREFAREDPSSLWACLTPATPAIVILYSDHVMPVLASRSYYEWGQWIDWPSFLGISMESFIASLAGGECLLIPE